MTYVYETVITASDDFYNPARALLVDPTARTNTLIGDRQTYMIDAYTLPCVGDSPGRRKPLNRHR